MKKIISFSLYGNKPNFQVGAITNVIEANRVYPDWQCRFYTTDDELICSQLEYLGAEVIRMHDWPDGNMFWRFLAVDDADVCLSRDADSVVNEREAAAVKEWLEETNYQWHAMHDYWAGHRKISMMGGMWGYRHYQNESEIPKDKPVFNFRETTMRQIINEWLLPSNKTCSGKYFDQIFLGEAIYSSKAQHNIKWSGDWVNAIGNDFPSAHYPIRYGRFVGDYAFWVNQWQPERTNMNDWLTKTIEEIIHTGWTKNPEDQKRVIELAKHIIKKSGGDVYD